MTKFRPCIDLHHGQVKQIVGGTLSDKDNSAKENFISEHSSAWYAELYRNDQVTGGHVIKLGPGNEDAAKEALQAWPNGLQIGGGIDLESASFWIAAGASHVIVTSWLFVNGEFSWERLEKLSQKIGSDKLVVDLSCRRQKETWFVATDRWQTITKTEVSPELLQELQPFCAEILIHAADVEGLQQGIDTELVEFLGKHCPMPVTYAGGAKDIDDLELVAKLSQGKVDLTIGSALDIFGGPTSYKECIKWNQA